MHDQLICDTRAQAVLDLITWRSRAATDEQVEDYLEALGFARTWRRKAKLGTLIARAEVVLALPEVEEPLALWCVDDEAPHFEALAWQLVCRRECAVPRRTTVYWATERATHLVGGVSSGLRRPLQLQHDLGVTAAYLSRLRLDPETQTEWLGEDVLRSGYGQLFPKKLPDAALIGADDTVYRLIEYGGHYDAARLRDFHRFAEKRGLDYELW